MSKPRRVNLLKTEHFDILFPSASSNSAKLLADNIEKLYDKAKSQLDGADDLHMPIIISPDSDRLSVDYTCSPYNRIVFFEGVPEEDNTNFENAVLGLFYHEIYLALSQSIRNPFNQFIYKTVGGDGYQPISMIYLPFSFVEGRAFIEDQKETDKQFLEILSIAKYENQFPNWLQAGTIRDVFPGREINEAAGTAFSAYLMQAYGIEKYQELWTLCGGINIALTAGMFKKVYGVSIKQLWQDFEDSIPVPTDIEELKKIEKSCNKLFPNDEAGAFENLVLSDYGLIWYDDIRHEVDIFDWNNKAKIRQLLFLASDVKKLTLSPDGRYMAVSFYSVKNRSQFRDDKVWIYDLQEREFLDNDFPLRDGELFYLENNITAVAGINVKDKKAKLQVYEIEYDDDELNLNYQRDFNFDEYPDSIVQSGEGKISFIYRKNNKNKLFQLNLKDKSEKSWNIIYKNHNVNIRDLRKLKTNKIESEKYYNKNIYTFNYNDDFEPGFTRIGVILLDDNFQPQKIYFQTNDFPGGLKSPVIYDEKLYFCSHKFSHTEINILDAEVVTFQEGTLIEESVVNQPKDETYSIHNKMLGDYEIKKYNPLKYMIHCSFVPFMAIKDLATFGEQKLWPSLGGTVITQDDPFMNNRIMVSGSAGYAKLDFTTIINPSEDELNDEKKHNVDDSKNFSFGISIENTSTPVDIRAGTIFKFNPYGEYNFTASLNTVWEIPIGMDFSKFQLGLYGNYTAATDYYDSNLTEHYPSKKGWPSFRNAYETGIATFGFQYTNVHQYGISKYQERGFSVGAKLYSFWDIYELRLLKDKFDKDNKDFSTSLKDLTTAQLSKLYDESMLDMSQLNMGIFASVKIPMLNPLTMKNGLVLSLPTTIKAEMFNNVGTAVQCTLESLLIGYEPQNGIPNLYLFFSRLGLYFGYDLCLNYDTFKVSLPDIRKKDYLWDVFSNVYVKDSIYFIYDMDFSASIGRLSEYQLNLNMKTEYFIRSKGFAFTMYFRVTH